MTKQIKPKQCGENAWYMPNQKGFVPEIKEQYWFCSHDGSENFFYHSGLSNDYAAIDAGNCFETQKEARDAFVKPVDPTPITWDELCNIDDIGEDAMVAMLNCFMGRAGEWVSAPQVEYACTVRRQGGLNFKVNKYWRGVDELSAWIEKQKEI
jgi:hypothetical protein